jgi:hypothetical protein
MLNGLGNLSFSFVNFTIGYNKYASPIALKKGLIAFPTQIALLDSKKQFHYK